MNNILGPHTLVSGWGLFSQADLRDILSRAFDVLVPSTLFLKLYHADRRPTCYLFVCFQYTFV